MDHRIVSLKAMTALVMFSVSAHLARSQDIPSTEIRADSGDAYEHVFVDSTRNAWNAALAGNGSGGYFCAWTERTAQGASIKGVFLHRGQRGGFGPIEASVPPAGAEDDRPAAVFLDDSTVLLAWQRRADRRHTLRARLVSRSGRCGPEQDVSDDDAACMMPAAGRDRQGGIVLAWLDYRNGNADVFARSFGTDGRPLGPGTKLNDDGDAAMQGGPRIAADNSNGVLVFWPDNREDGAWKFYYQRTGVPAAGNVLIDSAQRKAMTTLISGVVLPGDSALFAWKDYREGHSNIYRRVADLRGARLSPAVRVNDDTGDRWQRLATVDADALGRTVICWEDYRNTEINQRGDIYIQPFDVGGVQHGGNVRVNDREDRIARKMPQLVMDDDGWCLVVWHQGEDGRFHLAGQWLRYPAIREGGNFCLTCSAATKE